MEDYFKRQMEAAVRWGLTLKQLTVLQLLNSPSLLEYAISHRFDVDLRNTLVELQTKKFIHKSYQIPAAGTVFNPYKVRLNKKAHDALSYIEFGKTVDELRAQ